VQKCNKSLGFRKSKPEIFWKIGGYLCKDCYSYIEKTTQIFEAEYIEGF